MEVKVKLDTPTNGALFAATCSQYAEDIDFHYGSIVLDANADCQPKRPPVPYLAASL